MFSDVIYSSVITWHCEMGENDSRFIVSCYASVEEAGKEVVVVV